jgi:hypothetical protein
MPGLRNATPHSGMIRSKCPRLQLRTLLICDNVIANAEISLASGDDLWPRMVRLILFSFEIIFLTWRNIFKLSPVKPERNTVNVNLFGTMYAWKLAVHYSRKQPDDEDRDRCYIITGGMVSWIDSPVCLRNG